MIRLTISLLGLVSAIVTASAQTQTILPSKVCRAAIASVMGRDPSIMRTRPDGDAFYVTYSRPTDGKVWTYRCRVQGDRVVWANEQGPWRDGSLDGDSVITFVLSDNGKSVKITEVYRDGSKSQKSYPKSKLR